MKYFTLKIQAEPVFPQVQCLSEADARKLRTSELPTFIPRLTFHFSKGAQATDILSQASISANGLLINEKIKELLLNFNIIDHSLMKATIINSNTKYNWMHFLSNLENINWLNYEESSFYITEFGFREGDISINSYEDYCFKLKEVGDMSTINIERIKLNNLFDSDIDLFIVPFLTRDIFISERLKKAIENNHSTGIIIKDALIS